MLVFILLILAIIFIEKTYPYFKDEPGIDIEEYYRENIDYSFGFDKEDEEDKE